MNPTLHQDADLIPSPRVEQLGALFDLDPRSCGKRTWNITLPSETETWKIGMVAGPSGSGKSTLLRAAYGELLEAHEWPRDRPFVEAFPQAMSIQEISLALCSVGMSSPPSWFQPYESLSTGERFRVDMAYALCRHAPIMVVDEFTSSLDRTTAWFTSAALAKAIRRTEGKRLIVATCHSDVLEWLCPDWVVEMPNGRLTWRILRRPPIELRVRRVDRSLWRRFQQHHYLNSSIHRAAKCFAAYCNDEPIAFSAALHAPGLRSWWREHRTVCLPQYQGVGIGTALSDFVASVMKCLGKPYRSTTSHPAVIHHRMHSAEWVLVRKPSRNRCDHRWQRDSRSTTRLTAGFEYVGPMRPEDARCLGIT